MITLDANIYLLCSMFNISRKKLANEYSNMSVEEIMQAEAAQGNTAAANFDLSILSDPTKFIELFQLKDPANKYAILSNMNEQDLEDLLPLLEKSDLIMGLQFFTKDKLVRMLQDLPMEQLLKLTFEMFPPEQLMRLMPEEELNKVLMSPEMDKDLELEYLATMRPEILAQILETVTGQPVAGAQEQGMGNQAYMLDPQMLTDRIRDLPHDKYKEAMISIPTTQKQTFVYQMAQENPKIYQLFDPKAYTDIISQRKDKQDIIRCATVIENEQLVKMLEELPQDLTAVVLTQIDTKKFADVLLSSFKDIIKELAAG